MLRHTPRIALLWISALLAMVASLLSVTTTPASAVTTSPVGYAGEAFGTKIMIGQTAQSGPTAYAYMGCTSVPGLVNENTTATTNVAGLVNTGTTVDSVRSLADGTTYATESRSEIQGISLLGGLISADALSTVAKTSWNGAFSSTGGTTFLNLKVAGRSISATVAPNTRINLAGLGYVVLNQQQKQAPLLQPTQSMTVSAIHIVINQLNSSYKVGTDIVIGRAKSSLNAPIAGVMLGEAYGTYATLFGVVKHGKTAVKALPCTGTNGATQTNSTASVSIPGVKSGSVYSTAQGTVNAAQMSARMTNTIQSLNILNGLVTATTIRAEASGMRPFGGAAELTDAGSQFVNLKVNGHPLITDNVAPNTQIQLAGLGTLWLRRVIRQDDHTIEVHMIELVVNVDGAQLPNGTRIIVSSAKLRLGE